MSYEKRIMDTTVELVSAYMHSISSSEMNICKLDADEYAAFIETIYKKVESLTVTE